MVRHYLNTDHPLLDGPAKRVIAELQRDGRRSYTAISRTVGLSEAAVSQRAQRLINAGIMKIVAITDPLQLGLTRQALLGLKTSGNLEAIADKIATINDINCVVITGGSFDILLEVMVSHDGRLLEILQEVHAVEGVNTVETFVYLKLRG
ncbi:Lrp/AsnC family transcriptional regulator [Micromonospora chersina]|uniref:Lrp/AsnC family transcriptional regulator n=1 Tax=Micromonospora chersina TaxID=47854 RepID=UPI0037A8C489